MTLILLWLACSEAEPDPRADCLAEGSAACCGDQDCGAGEICHFSYFCTDRAGGRDCTEPIGDRQCHDLCELDTGDPFTCSDLDETCQTVEHVQGGDTTDPVDACF